MIAPLTEIYKGSNALYIFNEKNNFTTVLKFNEISEYEEFQIHINKLSDIFILLNKSEVHISHYILIIVNDRAIHLMYFIIKTENPPNGKL